MQTDHPPYTLGLDIGIASVGWCLLGERNIINLGVRCFDKAETAKEGESLNKIRRDARLMRRRLRRRAWRQTKLARTLKRHGVIDDTRLFQPEHPFAYSLWQLRVDALDRKLSPEEWARVIYHLCKHRGFHWISRAEEKKAEVDKAGEGGKVKKGLADTQKRMAENGYRSAAEMVLTEFPDAQRNKSGDYGKALSRVLLASELRLLFECQRALGNPYATETLQQEILGSGDRKSGLFWAQKPALSGADLLKMLGHCTFEKAEYRAPKASFTAERHVWLTRLNNLRIIVDGTTRPLNEHERAIALPLPYEQASDLTYKQLHAALAKKGGLPESFEFAGLRSVKDKDPKVQRLVRLPAWQELRTTLKKACLETEWQSMAGAAIAGDPRQLDDIAWVLSVFKDGTEVEAELRKLDLPGGEKMIDALSEIGFDKFHALSLKALRRIVPLMEKGARYDEAVAAIPEYGHHSQIQASSDKQKYLPPLYAGRDKDGRMVFSEEIDTPKNPVVLRALNQARKVVNAVIRRYGPPQAVHIEMARDLSKPLKGRFSEQGKYIEGRLDIQKKQDLYRAENEAAKSLFAEHFGQMPKGVEFEKWRLYREQQGKCTYSIQPIDLERLLEPGYVEIDHALPYSRSFDDSKNNKVLVLAAENRNKGNRTPYEYLDGKSGSPRWLAFKIYVETNKAYRLAKRSRLLRKDFGDKEAGEFRERNLNDTRYICKFFKNYVEQYLALAESSDAKRCVVLSGQLTAFLRARWGLIKIRDESDRHHALDAAIVAACSHGMVQKLANYARCKELENVRSGFVDMATGEIVNPAMHEQISRHFPDPWPHFRNELEARLKSDDVVTLQETLANLGAYPEAALQGVRPLFVSRAPQRRNSGAAHKDTIYAQPERLKKQGGVTQKVPLHSLTLKDLDQLVDPHRNEKLYAAIRARLEANGGKGDKAFPPGDPLRKPDRDGNPTGPIVRTVTMVIDKLSGIPVRGGVAKNDTMLRVDVFTKGGKFYLVPIYVHHCTAKELPNRAVVGKKDESQWTPIDNNFSFKFSLHPNDLFRLSIGQESVFGYFGGININDAGLKFFPHDKRGVDDLVKRGVASATAFDKFHVDVLGNIYPAPPEPRRGLA